MNPSNFLFFIINFWVAVYDPRRGVSQRTLSLPANLDLRGTVAMRVKHDSRMRFSSDSAQENFRQNSVAQCAKVFANVHFFGQPRFSMTHPYLFLVVLIGATLGFALTPLALAWLWAKKFSPRKPGKDKNAIYECGLESKPAEWMQFKSQYYLYGIIFLIFDVETIFLLPFAVAFKGLSVGGFVAIMIFLLLLVEGLAWAWAKGVLTWK
jgi:NADH-quinone oxidoreductase subunit A